MKIHIIRITHILIFLFFINSTIYAIGLFTNRMPNGILIKKPKVLSKKVYSIRIWLDKIDIEDAKKYERIILEESLTLNILTFIRNSRYYKTVILSPGKINDNDLIFKFNFKKYSVTRSLDMKFLPLVFITLSLYMWFGGTVDIDLAHYECELIVYDNKNIIIYRRSITEKKIKKNNIYSDESFSLNIHSGTDARTSIIKKLLEDFNKNYFKKIEDLK